jgi:MFS family permease
MFLGPSWGRPIVARQPSSAWPARGWRTAPILERQAPAQWFILGTDQVVNPSAAGLNLERSGQNKKRDDRIFTPGFVRLGAAQISQSTGVTIVFTTVALLVVERLHLGAPIAGVVVALMFASSFMTRLPLGGAVDHHSRSQSGVVGFGIGGALGLIVGAALYILAGLDVSVPLSAWGIPLLLVAAALVSGVASSSSTTAASSQLANMVPPSRRGEAVGYFGIASTLGNGVGAGVSFALFHEGGYGAPFAAAAALFGLASLLWFSMRRLLVRAATTHHETRLRLELSVLAPSWANYCLLTGHSAAFAFVPLLALTRGIPNPGLFFIFGAITAIGSRVFGGRIGDRIGQFRLVIPGLALHATGLVLASQATSTEALALAGCAVGLGFAIVQSGTLTLAIDLAGPTSRASGIATYLASQDAGVVSGTTIAGALAPLFGYDGLFLVLSALPVAGLVVLSAWRVRHGPVVRR